ncbi:MAG: nucleotidyltransferase domain-containing protein [Spirochaetota bacterium]
MVADEDLNRIRKDLSLFYEKARAEYPIVKLFLFGSYAKGNPRRDSDIDVGVVIAASKIENRIPIMSRLMYLAHTIDVNIEPYVICKGDYESPEPGSILAEIVQTSKEIPIQAA